MKARSVGRAVLATLAALTLAACGGGGGGGCGDGLALEGVTVIDGLANPPLADQTVVLCDGTIAAIGPAATTRVPGGAKRARLQGRYVLPGLIDTHAHVSILARGEDGVVTGLDHEASERTLRTLLAFGVTTVRNPAAPAAEGVGLREAVAAGELLGPRIRTAGDALNRAASDLGPLVAVADGAAARAEVERQAALGVDFIKLYAALAPDVVAAAVEAARQRGLPVIGHLQRTTWTEGARLGIDYLTHAAPWSAAYLPEALRADYQGSLRERATWLEAVDFEGPAIGELLATLVAEGVSIDPTLLAQRTKFFGDDPRHTAHPELDLVPSSVLASWRRRSFTDDWSTADFASGHAAWPRLLEWTRRLHEAGVPLTAGSDLPNPWVIPGVSLHEELQFLVEAGIAPLEVVRIATHNGARAVGLADEVGSVEVGKRADLIVLAADPLRRIANTRAIEFVLLGGRVLSPAALLSEGAH